jgi:stage IV sporulation protein B
MKLIVGKEENFQFNLPFQANLMPEKQGVVRVNESNVPEDQIKLSLRDPFTIQSSEEGSINVELKLFGFIPIKQVKVDVISQNELIPAGLTVGVVVSTDGVMVLGTGVVRGIDGTNYEPSKGLLNSGDYIVKINNQPIYTKDELVRMINANKEKELNLTVRRGNDLEEVKVSPIKASGVEDYKIGIWVRDDTQGIGTITYINDQEETFGALGHGITDADTKQLITVNDGDILETQITTITKGQKGLPGEIAGVIVDDDESLLGHVSKNTQYGIFGSINDKIYKLVERKPLPIGLKHEVKEGIAYIRSCVDGTIKDYEIEIEKIYLGSNDINKGMVIKVTDSELLSKTNGIVQGMSGSPIIQDNKIIGAVTHVFVQDSTKGYGTFIENMLKSEKE